MTTPTDGMVWVPYPCGCCATGQSGCILLAVRFDSVAQTAPASGWTPVNLAATADGVTATTLISGYNSPGGPAVPPTPEVTYTVTPQSRVRGLFLWNQTGGDLGDADGLGTFTADFYSGTALLYSTSFTGVNGGQRQSLLFPGTTLLNGVDRVVLHDLGKQSGSSVSPTWRELQLAELTSVSQCRRPNGVVEWHDSQGNLIPAADLVPCDGSPVVGPMTVLDLTVEGVAFNYIADPSGTDEVQTLTPTASTVSTGVVPVAPNHYRVSSTAPGTPCGGQRSILRYQPASTFDYTYGALDPGRAVGGVWIQFSAPSIGLGPGGVLDFGFWTAGSFTPGQSKTIAVTGGTATLTYVSGPSTCNAPRGDGPFCALGAAGTQTIGLHACSTGTTDQPIHMRLSFTTT